MTLDAQTISRTDQKIGLLWIGPAILCLAVILAYGVSMPGSDEIHLGEYLIRAVRRGHPLFSELMSQHNESRMFFPRIVLFVNAKLTGWNLRYQMVLSWVEILCSALIARKLAFATLPPQVAAWTSAYVGTLLFGINQYANLLWGMQFAAFVPMLGLCLGLWALSWNRGMWLRFTVAVLAATLATFSFANGLILWAVVFPAVLFAPRQKAWARAAYSVGWLLIGAAEAAYYMTDYKPGDYTKWDPHLITKWTYVNFVAVFSGNAPRTFVEMPGTIYLTSLTGWAFIVVFGAACALLARDWVKHREASAARAALPWLLFGAYTLLSAGMATVGRISPELEWARSERYVTYAIPLMASLVPLTYLALRRFRPGCPGLGTSVSRPVGIACMTLAAAGCAASWQAQFTSIVMRSKTSYQAVMEARLNLVAPNRAEFWKVHSSYPYGVEILGGLEQLDLLRFGVIHAQYAEEMLYPKIEAKPAFRGQLEGAAREGDRARLTGYAASIPDRKRPADAIVIARVEPDGRHKLVTHTALTEKPREDVFIKRKGWPINCGWDVLLEAKDSAVGTKLAAYIFDAKSGKLYPIPGEFVIR